MAGHIQVHASTTRIGMINSVDSEITVELPLCDVPDGGTTVQLKAALHQGQQVQQGT